MSGDDFGAEEMSRREEFLGVAFIFVVVIASVKAVVLSFDWVFFVAAGIALALLLMTKHKAAYVAAAFLWMAFRFLFGFVTTGDGRALGLAAGFGAIGVAILVFGARRELRSDEARRKRFL